ncbi:MAG: hypothetical protein JW701_06045, partial [Kosmotogaceae bacterium]|nr:hypothetical protein [Kosmotogaceae bacterium]
NCGHLLYGARVCEQCGFDNLPPNQLADLVAQRLGLVVTPAMQEWLVACFEAPSQVHYLHLMGEAYRELSPADHAVFVKLEQGMDDDEWSQSLELVDK